MNAATVLKYLAGHRGAVLEVARSRVWFPLGVLLVLITSIPRNYDQTWIGEKPFLWVAGPLLFSAVSGTFVFVVLYYGVLRWRVDPSLPEVPVRQQWASFMGLFWLTAPVAWVYALPVERFLSPVAATKANLCLLAGVALWRVLLMARVVQVVNGAPFARALVWVLVPACAEVVAVAAVGTAAAMNLAASMGGMRNSPEEDMLLGVFGMVFWLALFGLCLMSAVAWMTSAESELRDRPGAHTRPFPAPRPARTPWGAVLAAAVLWVAAAVPAQRQVRRNSEVETLVSNGEPRAALDFLAARQPGDFAPSRALPPAAFEWGVFHQLPPLVGAVRADDPAWVRAHLLQRLDEMCSHFRGRRRGGERAGDPWAGTEPAQLVLRLAQNYGSPEPGAWVEVINGLLRMPEGPNWIVSNRALFQALLGAAELNDTGTEHDADDDGDAEAWRTLVSLLSTMGFEAPSV